jgi:hypothetical protein
LAASVNTVDAPPLGAAAAADEFELAVVLELAAALDELLLDPPQAARTSASMAALNNTAGNLGMREPPLEVFAHLKTPARFQCFPNRGRRCCCATEYTRPRGGVYRVHYNVLAGQSPSGWP